MIPSKATILCVYDILKTYSDEEHILSAEKIREKLKTVYDVDMERRAIYRNIDALRSMGVEIEGYQDNREGYYLADREFELPEVRLLCDAVAASDIIREETGKKIIRKLVDTQSIFQGRMLQKTVFVKSGQRILNHQIFYNIDALNIAINQGCKVRARILEYGLEQELKECQDSPLVFSPYATLWAGGNYYVLAIKEGGGELKHLRLDLMKDISILEQGADMAFGSFNPSQYAEAYILQKGEAKGYYEIECGQGLWQELAEQFGKGASVIRKTDRTVTVKIHAIPSDVRGWVMNHLSDCEVLAPREFRGEIQAAVLEGYRKYWKNRI